MAYLRTSESPLPEGHQVPRLSERHEATLLHSGSMDEHFLSYLSQVFDGPVVTVSGFGAKLVFRENHHTREFWNIILLVLLMHSALVMPYTLAFYDFGKPDCKEAGVHYENWEFIVQVGFYFDFFFNFVCSYRDARDKEVLCLKKIAFNYLCSYFIINFVSCFPLELFFGGSDSCSEQSHVNEAGRLFRVSRVSRMARLLRLVRLVRLTKLAAVLQHGVVASLFQQLKSWWFTQVINLLAALFFVVHVLGCGWWIVGSLEADEASWLSRRSFSDGVPLLEAPARPFYQWMTSVYYVLIVFTTVGLGDISAVSEVEMIYTGMTMIVGAIANSIILSSAITLISNKDAQEQALSTQRDMLKCFAMQTQMLPEVSDLLDSWAANTQLYQHTYSRDDALHIFSGSAIPFNLLNELPDKLFGGDLVKSKLLSSCLRQSGFGFATVPPRFALVLALGSQVSYTIGGGIVYQSHDSTWNVFMVTEGTFAYVAKHHANGGFAHIPHSVWAAGRAWNGLIDDSVQEMSSLKPIFRSSGKKMKKEKLEGLMTAQDEEEADMSPYKLFGRHNYFGDIEVFLHTNGRVNTARCESPNGALVALSKRDLTRVSEEFPFCLRAWRTRAKQRNVQCKLALNQLRQTRTYRKMAVTTIENFYHEYLHTRKVNKKTTIEKVANNNLSDMVKNVEEIPQEFLGVRMDVTNLQQGVIEMQKKWDEEVANVNTMLKSMIMNLNSRSEKAEDDVELVL